MVKTRTEPKKKGAKKKPHPSPQPSSTSESTKGIVEYRTMNPQELSANPLNWRIHDLNQKRAIRASREKFGDVIPVIFNQRTGLLVDGHARVEDACAKGDTEIPVAIVDLDPADEAELLLAFDSIGSMAKGDEDAITKLSNLIAKNRAELKERFEPTEVAKTLRNLHASIAANAGKFATNPFSTRGQVAPAPLPVTTKEFDDDAGEDEYAGDEEEGSGETESESDLRGPSLDRRLRAIEGASEEDIAKIKEDVEKYRERLDHSSVSPETIELAVSLVSVKFDFAEPVELEVPALSPETDNPKHYVQAEDLPDDLTTWGGSGNPNPGPGAIYCISSSPFPIDREGGFLFTHTNDNRFDHLWKDPALYALNILEDGWQGVLEPEYSLFWKNDFPINLGNLYKRRRLARYYQELGIPIVPIISAFANPYSEFLPIDTLPSGVPVVSYQIRGLPKEASKRAERIDYILEVLQYAVEDIEPQVVILYGGTDYAALLDGKLPSGPDYRLVPAYASSRREQIKRKKKIEGK